MELENRKTPGLVLSAEYFPHSESKKHPLEILLKDPEVRDCVSGIWVPAHLTTHHETMDDLITIANGKSHIEYEFVASHPYDDEANEYVANPNKPKQTSKPLPLIIDTCVSGAAPVERIYSLLSNWRSKKNILTLTLGVEKEGIEEIVSEFSDRDDVEFYMVATYPENTPEGIEEFHKQTEEQYTNHVAQIVDRYGLDGVVGFAGLATATLQNQRLLDMGITVDGKNYVAGMQSGSSKQKIKRSKTPKRGLKGASFQADGTCNTELVLGRAVLPEDLEHVGTYKSRWQELGEDDKIEVMRANILRIRDMADEAIRQ